MGKSEKPSAGTSKHDVAARASDTGQSVSPNSDIASFLDVASKVKTHAGGRSGLIFALDATMSREATWDMALGIQAQMFDAVADTGLLDVQLVYFRGFGECRASRWVRDTSSLRNLMTGIGCRGGQTQIGKILTHARKETAKSDDPRVKALVFVGDAMEEDVDALCHKAGELGVLGVPAFMFQEGRDGRTERAFREISKLSGGAFMRFGAGSAGQLAELLKAVARYAAGGRAALAQDKSRTAQTMLEQLR